MKKKQNLVILLIGTAIFIVFLIIIWRKLKTPNSIQPYTSFLSPTVTNKIHKLDYEITDDQNHLGWKIYTDKTSNFTLSFPEELAFKEDQAEPPYAIVESPNFSTNGGYGFKMAKIGDTREGNNYETFVQSIPLGIKSSLDKCQIINPKIKGTATNVHEVTVSNYKCLTYSIDNCGDGNSNTYILKRGPEYFYIVIYVKGNDRNIKMNKAKEILNTLKFAE